MVVAVHGDIGHPLQLRLLCGASAQGLVDGGQPFQVVLIDDAVPGSGLLRVACKSRTQVPQELHDRRLFTAKAPGVEVVGEIVELRQDATPLSYSLSVQRFLTQVYLSWPSSISYTAKNRVRRSPPTVSCR